MEACLLSRQKEIVDAAATAMIQNPGTPAYNTQLIIEMPNLFIQEQSQYTS